MSESDSTSSTDSTDSASSTKQTLPSKLSHAIDICRDIVADPNFAQIPLEEYILRLETEEEIKIFTIGFLLGTNNNIESLVKALAHSDKIVPR